MHAQNTGFQWQNAHCYICASSLLAENSFKSEPLRCLVPSRSAMPSPQDMQTGALMVAGQMKEILDNGAAARNEKKFEVFGMEFGNNMEIGFGDAMKSRRRRAIEDLSSDESSSDESSSSLSSSIDSTESSSIDSTESSSDESGE